MNDDKRERQRAAGKRHYYRHLTDIREKKAAQMRVRRKHSALAIANQKRDSLRRLREKLLDMYGRTCVRCGFADIRALTLDHVNNDGAEERRRTGSRGPWRLAAAEFRPDRYRTLCMNCQFIVRSEVGTDFGPLMKVEKSLPLFEEFQ